MTIINADTLAITGMLTNFVGGILLAIESLSSRNLNWIPLYMYKFSKWSKKSLKNAFLVYGPITLLGPIFLLSQTQIGIALWFPITLSILFFSTLSDITMTSEDWIRNFQKNQKLSPSGFFLLVIGTFLQLIGYIWKM